MLCYACGHPIVLFRKRTYHICRSGELSISCEKCGCHKAVMDDEDEKTPYELFQPPE